jgi:hypothetical protein
MTRKVARTTSRGPSRPLYRRLARRLLLTALLCLVVVATATAGFIGVQCTGRGTGGKAPDAAGPTAIEGYARPEAFTFLTLPEWFIVYSADEYGRFIQDRSPSDFPYLSSIGEYWGYYGTVCRVTREAYPFETGYHVMLGVIGASFTIENAVKSAYENTAGRLSAWLSGRDTPEDRFAAETAAEYGTFMHTTPWYEFPFASRLGRLWTEVPATGPHVLRKWERRVALTAEYGTKALYGGVIALATRGAYAPEDLTVHATVEHAEARALLAVPRVEHVRDDGGGVHVIRLPRYEAFTAAALAVLGAGARFREVAGNDEILITAVGPSGLGERAFGAGTVLAVRPILTEPARARVVLRVPVAQLHRSVPELTGAGAAIERLYDY